MKGIEETKSNWECVSKNMLSTPKITLGYYSSYWMRRTPRRMLHSQSYYKFASKMIGSPKSVVDVGCNEGFGTYLLGKECGSALGIDFDTTAITTAKSNFGSCERISFLETDFFDYTPEHTYDAVVNFDVIEHIYPENSRVFIKKLASLLHEAGVCIVGTPSKISQEFASPVSLQGHVNIYSHERLLEEMQEAFKFVFLFSANDEVIHTGYYPLAHYFICLCCSPK